MGGGGGEWWSRWLLGHAAHFPVGIIQTRLYLPTTSSLGAGGLKTDLHLTKALATWEHCCLQPHPPPACPALALCAQHRIPSGKVQMM